MILTDEQRRALEEILAQAFSVAALRHALRSALRVDLDLITADTDMSRVPALVVAAAQADGWLPGLLRIVEEGAALSRESAAALAGLRDWTALQRLIRDTDAFIDTGRASAAIGRAMERVCRIDVAGAAGGTGFLIGADLVLTNFHVIEGCVPSEVTARFDHRCGEGGEVLAGLTCNVTDFLEHSAYHETDCVPGDHDIAPLLTHLDYALLRLARPVGTMLAKSGKAPRGWYHPGERPSRIRPNCRLLIFQHPNGGPLQFDDRTVLSVNDNGTRVRYDVNTLPGSSGGLGLDGTMEPAVIHHAGDPSWRPAEYNQGIPIALVAADIESRRPGILVPSPPKPPHLWQVWGDHPVIGRSSLQDRISLMLAGRGPRVLFVEGAERSGRSFIRHLVQAQVAAEDGSCASISLAAFAGLTPDYLAEEVAAEFGLDRAVLPRRPEDRQAARWAPALGSALVKALRAKARLERGSVWLIVDCTDPVTLPEETLELFVDVVRRAFDEEGLRVVVIGGAELLPPAIARTTSREAVNFVLAAEVADHLTLCAGLGGRDLPRADAEELASEAMAGLSSDPLDRWYELVDRVRRLDAVLLGDAA